MTWTIDFNNITTARESWRGGWSSYGVIAVFPTQLSLRRTVRGLGRRADECALVGPSYRPWQCVRSRKEQRARVQLTGGESLTAAKRTRRCFAHRQPCLMIHNYVRLAPHFELMFVCNGVGSHLQEDIVDKLYAWAGVGTQPGRRPAMG